MNTQYSLLNRNVFYRRNFHHWSSSLDHLVICIFKSSSSSIHLHLWIWIITRSRSSSLDLYHHSIWIISGHHHSIWIITTRSSSLDHHGCYLMILLVTRSSIELALFHVGCRPSLHVGLFQCLYLTLSQNGPSNTYI